MMRANEYSWYRFEMSRKTVEEKRAAILRCAKLTMDRAAEKGFTHGSVESLKENICYIMDWTAGTWNNGERGYRRKVWVIPATEDPRVQRTIENMVSKGIIELSKSGKGFKLLTAAE